MRRMLRMGSICSAIAGSSGRRPRTDDATKQTVSLSRVQTPVFHLYRQTRNRHEARLVRLLCRKMETRLCLLMKTVSLELIFQMTPTRRQKLA